MGLVPADIKTSNYNLLFADEIRPAFQSENGGGRDTLWYGY